MRLTPFLAALPAANAAAFQLPFKIPFFQSNKQEFQLPTNSETRIAIIGAGAAGSSAAYWISKAQERFSIPIDAVDVFEQASYVGGRTVVYPYGNPTLPAVELGASIFIPKNRNMWRAVDEFNLTRRDFQDEEGLGIWDGEKLLFTTTGGWWSYWDAAKALLRYGFHSPRRTQKAVDGMVAKFLTLYSSQTPKWSKIEDLATALDWDSLVSRNTVEWLKAEGVSDKFISELVEASTRVNYGQNADEIHALEGACSLAPTGAVGVQGGNYQVFEQFLNRSGANLYLNTTVKSIAPRSGKWKVVSDRGSETYTAVILGAPWHSSNIQLPAEIKIPVQPYVHLHVTLLSTTLASLPAESLGLPSSTKIPAMLLTTYEGARNGGKTPEFNSLSYHGKISDEEWVVKIFSKQRITDDWLNTMFNGQVGWVHRKEWDAYPVLPPTSTFPEVKLAPGLYYANSFEPFISTMETETISSRNIVDQLLAEHFNASICGATDVIKDADDYVYGWDC
ncbi:Prenylcysteine lyase [Mycena indigotica]|uniref:Prenylcysteine lyase n=1 Tax=Mycena indigotica TaxID=2126181 RepID=A0A8H6SZ76_9AGAR|nr:Prenylcysteine lyase [Mycena indigotica]KAF7306595.1 Prenylcysteine lyase [Mycena indigotica]